MILGNIIGKTNTKEFKFLVKGNARKFEYVQVMHRDNYYVLAQILEIEKDLEQEIAICGMIGFRDNNKLKPINIPLEIGSEVLYAQDDFVKEVLGLMEEKGAYIGVVDGRENIKVFLDINKMLTKHLSVIAKTGTGKSFFSGVIVEELIDKNVPILIIDPHGEYPSLKEASKEIEELNKFGIKAKGYLNKIQEFSPDISINREAKPLKLNNKNLSATELIHLLPAKLSNTQKTALYAALRNVQGNLDFNSVVFALEQEESSVKWTLMSVIEYIQKLNLFSDSYTRPLELIKPGTATIINLKGIDPEIQEVVVYKLVKDLFEERKKGNIPPFFLLIEETHNFVPERSFGEAKSSGILRQLASESRKFGIGACFVSQRPSRVDKNVLSQCGTQVIFKITNPNDIKAVVNSVEGITMHTENEISNIPIGTAMITGVVDLPLFVKIRARKTKHGGEAVKIFDEEKEEEKDLTQEIKEFTREVLPLVKPSFSSNDFKIINNVEPEVVLVPCLFLTCEKNKNEFNILIDLAKGKIITNTDSGEGVDISFQDLNLSNSQRKIFDIALTMDEFKPGELFAKSQVNFSEVYDVILNLANKGIFVKVGDKYRLNDKLTLYSRLEKYACYKNMDYENAVYDKKLEKKFQTSEIINFLNKFFNIKEEKECFLVRYV